MCPLCATATSVRLLASIEVGDHRSHTWVCRSCLVSFGDSEKISHPRLPAWFTTAAVGIGTLALFIFGARKLKLRAASSA